MSVSIKLPVHITASDLVEGTSKAGNPFKMVRIQGVLELGEDRQIFRTVLPTGSEVPKPGRYLADFAPRVNNQNMELGGGITGIAPAPAAKPAAGA